MFATKKSVITSAIAHTRTDPALTLRLAGSLFKIQGIPYGWSKLVPNRLLTCLEKTDSADRTINIELSDAHYLRPVPGPHNLNETSRLVSNKETVRYVSDWCDSQFAVDSHAPVHLLVHENAGPWFGGVIENLIRVLVAYDVLGRGGILLHSAAIVRENKAVVLFGHSGAGKSTASGIAAEAGLSVISDDINVIARVGDEWRVIPVPFSGTFEQADFQHAPASLSGIYRLNQSNENYSEPCSVARAVSRLMSCSPFVNQDKYRAEQLLDVLTSLALDPGVRDLYLTPSKKFLGHIFTTTT